MSDMPQDTVALASKLRRVLADINAHLVDREALTQVLVLAAVAREHLLVLGPPGTAKSAAIRAVAGALDGSYFEYLLGRFTEPSELFGPVDLRKLREGTVETETRGMLPEAEFAFLDEIFLGSTAILNTLLALLNERRFRRGSTIMQCPLRVCVAASNHLPEDEALAAFADRFLVRLYVDGLADSRIEDLLRVGRRFDEIPRSAERFSLAELDLLSQAARTVDLSAIHAPLGHCVRLLRKAGVMLSDRRIVKTQNLIAASTVLNGRAVASEADLWPLVYVIPTAEAQAQARDVLQKTLVQSENSVMAEAVSNASAGPAARAGRIELDAGRLLAQRPAALEADDPWSLRAEALLREIDAGFAAGQVPEALAGLRGRLAEAVATPSLPTLPVAAEP